MKIVQTKLFLGTAWSRSCRNDSSGRSEVIFEEIVNHPGSQWGVCLCARWV